jgi:hypothetical protein
VLQTVAGQRFDRFDEGAKWANADMDLYVGVATGNEDGNEGGRTVDSAHVRAAEAIQNLIPHDVDSRMHAALHAATRSVLNTSTSRFGSHPPERAARALSIVESIQSMGYELPQKERQGWGSGEQENYDFFLGLWNPRWMSTVTLTHPTTKRMIQVIAVDLAVLGSLSEAIAYYDMSFLKNWYDGKVTKITHPMHIVERTGTYNLCRLKMLTREWKTKTSNDVMAARQTDLWRASKFVSHKQTEVHQNLMGRVIKYETRGFRVVGPQPPPVPFDKNVPPAKW